MMHRRVAVLVASMVGAALVAAPTFAAGVNARLELSVTPYRVVIESRPDGAPITQALTIIVQVTVPAEVRIGMSDVVAGPDGGLVNAALGSTPYSLGTSVVVEPALILVDPGADRQTFKVTIAVKAAASDPPHIGALTVALFPRGKSDGVTGIVTQGLSMTSTVLSRPPEGGEAAIADATAVLQASALEVRRGAPWTPLDQVVPDLLPALVDHGPVTAIARFTNTGNVILDSTTTFKFSSVSPLALLPGNTETGPNLYSITPLPGYALPGQVTSSDADRMLRAKDATPTDMLPFLGFVRITATTTGTLGALQAEPIRQSIVILVFPWKELLALLLVVLLWSLFRAWFKRWRSKRRLLAEEKRAWAEGAARAISDPGPAAAPATPGLSDTPYGTGFPGAPGNASGDDRRPRAW